MVNFIKNQLLKSVDYIAIFKIVIYRHNNYKQYNIEF